MASLLRQGARRIGGSVLQRTQAAAAVTSPTVAEEQRRLVTRRMYTTEELARQGYLRKKYGDLKPYQIYWKLFKLAPVGKIFVLVAGATWVVVLASAGRQVILEEKAEKIREQSARKELMPEKAVKKREQ